MVMLSGGSSYVIDWGYPYPNTVTIAPDPAAFEISFDTPALVLVLSPAEYMLEWSGYASPLQLAVSPARKDFEYSMGMMSLLGTYVRPTLSARYAAVHSLLAESEDAAVIEAESRSSYSLKAGDD